MSQGHKTIKDNEKNYNIRTFFNHVPPIQQLPDIFHTMYHDLHEYRWNHDLES